MNDILCAGQSDTGRVRSHNEDRWVVDRLAGLFLVADGLGGEAAGGMAAEMVVSALPPLLRGHLRGVRDLADPRASERLRAAVGELNRQVWSESRKHPALEGMGATLVLALLRDCQALIAHAGDSRAYLLRQGEFRQMTRDHTPVQRLLDEGKITLRESADHPQAGLLSRYLGMSQDIAVDVSFLDLEPSDRLLLCSDGVTTPLTAAEIHGILELGQPPEETCRFLIDAANLRGGEDNATAVLVALESSPRANKTTSRIRLPALRDPS